MAGAAGLAVTSELSSQLLEALDRPGTPAEPVWWVAKLAIGGGCRDLTDRLRVLAGDASLADYARTACIEAVGQLGTGEQHRGLRVFLELDTEDDRDDELLAATIQELYPDELPTVELLQALRPRRRKNLFGGYATLLSQLGTMVPDHDLPATLAWLAALANDSADEFDDLSRLVSELLRRAWGADDAARASLADMLAHLDDVPRWTIGSGRLESPWTAPELTARRRMLAVDVAARLESHDHAHALMDLRLIENADLPWLLDELASLPEPARGVLARIVPWLTYGLSADLADRIVRLDSGHPAWEYTRHLRGQCQLDSPDAARGRQRADREHEMDRQRVSRDEHRDRIQQALIAAEVDPSSWPQVVHALASPNDNRIDEALYADLTARSGWSVLSEAESARVFAIGLTFVAGHTPDPGRWRGQQTISGPDWIRDWAGVWLLTTLLRHDPDRLDVVSVDTWCRLAPALVGAWDPGGGDSGGGLRGLLLQQAPPEALPTLAEAALEQLDADLAAGRGTISLHNLGVLTPLLGPQLVDRLLVDDSDDVSARELVAFLAEAADQVSAVIGWLQTLGESALPPVAQSARLHLADLAPRSTLVTVLEPETEEDERRNLICRLAFPDLDNVQLARFAEMLLERYPSEGGPYEAAVAQGDTMLTVENVRWRVLQLLAQRAQVETLVSFAQASDGQDRLTLNYLAGQAKLHRADQALSPVAPAVLIEVLQRGDARLVRSDGDLLDVLIEQLGRIQQRLHGQGHARFLWNEDTTTAVNSLKSENDISLWIASQLQDTLGGVLIDRELEVTPSRVGSGTRVDLTATAPTATYPADSARVLIEAKRYDNADLLRGLRDQLVDRYLLPESRTTGLYLVYWVDTALRPAGSRGRSRHPNLAELHSILEQQTQSMPATLTVRPVVLDVSPILRTAGGSEDHQS